MKKMKEKTLAIASAIVLIVALLNCLPVYATGAGTTATVLNSAPTVSSVDLTPDDVPAMPGVQVINPEPTTNKTVTVTATVCDLNGWDDIVNTSVIATITGPSVIEESPVSLSFDTVVTATTVVYTGSFNMSNHLEGDYEVEVTATDFGGSMGAGAKNFTYLYTVPEDTIPPIVKNPSANPAAIVADGILESRLNVTVTDASGIYSVTVNLTEVGGLAAKAMTNIPGTDVYTTNATAAVGTPPGTYYLPVNATDNSPNRNSNTSVSIPLTVLHAEAVTTYDFATGAGLDKWAYRKEHNAKPPVTNDVPSIEFGSREYGRISIDDRKVQRDSTRLNGYYAVHRFKFDITQPVGSIVEIAVLWNGAGTHADKKAVQGATLYLWNFNSGAYEQLNITSSKKEVYLTGMITENVGNYIDTTGNLTIQVEQNSPQGGKASKISTDYVKVDITYLSLSASMSTSTSTTTAVSEASTAEETVNSLLDRVQQGGISLFRWLFGEE